MYALLKMVYLAIYLVLVGGLHKMDQILIKMQYQMVKMELIAILQMETCVAE